MKALHVIGITIPLIIIISVMVVAILDVGVTIESYSPKIIDRESIYRTENYTGEQKGPVIRTITIKNNFIFTRREQLDYTLCPKTKESANYYYHMDYTIDSDGSDLGFVREVNVKPGETKVVELKLLRLYNHPITEDSEVEEIVLFKASGGALRRKDCSALLSEDANKGVFIKVE